MEQKIKEIINTLSMDKEFVFTADTKSGLTPRLVWKILEDLGWNYNDNSSWSSYSKNWDYFSHQDYDFVIILMANNFYWELELYRADIDDYT